MLKEIFLGRERILTPKGIIFHAALILISVLFVYMFSYSTSFRYSMFGGDSAVFQVVGKYWLEGVIPYKDLFDHKGALVYVANALGYAIYPRAGVMVPQIICLYLSSLFVWRAIGLYWRGNVVKIFFLALTLIYYAAHYWEGNNSGEYTMPFLAASAYCFLRYLKDEEVTCPPLYGLIYGLSFGGCVLIRASNAMPTCCFAFLTAIFLLQARAFKNLWQNVLSFCVGFAAIVLPFVIYFAAHGAFYDMLYGTILLNTKYAIDGKIEYGLEQRLAYSIFKLMPVFLMIFFGIILTTRDVKNKMAWSGIFIGVMVSALLMNLRLYIHYYMIVVPTIPILLAILKQFNGVAKKISCSSKFSVAKIFYGIIIICTATYAILALFMYSLPLMSYFQPQFVAMQKEFYQKELHGVQSLKSLIPDNEKNSFVCWGDFCSTSHWILETNMKSRERFFMNNTDYRCWIRGLKRSFLEMYLTRHRCGFCMARTNIKRQRIALTNITAIQMLSDCWQRNIFCAVIR